MIMITIIVVVVVVVVIVVVIERPLMSVLYWTSAL